MSKNINSSDFNFSTFALVLFYFIYFNSALRLKKLVNSRDTEIAYIKKDN